jgi:hypothetical protein
MIRQLGHAGAALPRVRGIIVLSYDFFYLCPVQTIYFRDGKGVVVLKKIMINSLLRSRSLGGAMCTKLKGWALDSATFVRHVYCIADYLHMKIRT